MPSPKIKIKTSYDVTDYRGDKDIIRGFYLSILGNHIFRSLERIDSNQPYLRAFLQVHASEGKVSGWERILARKEKWKYDSIFGVELYASKK